MSTHRHWMKHLRKSINEGLYHDSDTLHGAFITSERLNEIWNTHGQERKTLFELVTNLSHNQNFERRIQILSTLVYIKFDEWEIISRLIEEHELFLDDQLPFDYHTVEQFFPGDVQAFCESQHIFCPIQIKLDETTVARAGQRLPVISETPVGSGAYGTVTRAEIAPFCFLTWHEQRWVTQNAQTRVVALKRFSLSYDARIESDTLRRLNLKDWQNTRIVRSLACVEIPSNNPMRNEHVIFFELLELDLSTFLERNEHPELHVKPPLITPFGLMKELCGLAGALRYLHEECLLCHRDLRPPNILISLKAGYPLGHWRITDFGLARFGAAAQTANQASHYALSKDPASVDIHYFGSLLALVLLYAIGGKDGVKLVEALWYGYPPQLSTQDEESWATHPRNKAIRFLQSLVSGNTQPNWIDQLWKILRPTLENVQSYVTARNLEQCLKDICANSQPPEKENVWLSYRALLEHAIEALYDNQGEPSGSSSTQQTSVLLSTNSNSQDPDLSELALPTTRSLDQPTSQLDYPSEQDQDIDRTTSSGFQGHLSSERERLDGISHPTLENGHTATSVPPTEFCELQFDVVSSSGARCIHIAEDNANISFSSEQGAFFVGKDDFSSSFKPIPGADKVSWDRLQITSSFVFMMRERDDKKGCSFKAELRELPGVSNQFPRQDWHNLIDDVDSLHQIEISESHKIAVCFSQRLILYDFGGNKLLDFHLESGHDLGMDNFSTIKFDRKGSFLFALSWKRWFQWDLRAGHTGYPMQRNRHECTRMDHGRQNLSILPIPGGGSFLVYDKAGSRRCYHIATRPPHGEFQFRLTRNPVEMTVSPDGERLIYIARSKKIGLSSTLRVFSHVITSGYMSDGDLPRISKTDVKKKKLASIKSTRGLCLSALSFTDHGTIVILAVPGTKHKPITVEWGTI